jgi:hypothetical protein
MMADAMKDVLLQDGNDTCMVAMIATDKAGVSLSRTPEYPHNYYVKYSNVQNNGPKL